MTATTPTRCQCARRSTSSRRRRRDAALQCSVTCSSWGRRRPSSIASSAHTRRGGGSICSSPSARWRRTCSPRSRATRVPSPTPTGTPTMGGVIIFIAISIPFLILSDYDWRSVGVFAAAICCALLGFADDYTKLVRRRSLGLRARTKLAVTIAISLGLWFIASHEAHLASTLRLRFVDYQINLG